VLADVLYSVAIYTAQYRILSVTT